MDKRVKAVVDDCGILEDMAFGLLLKNNWNVQKVIDHFLEDPIYGNLEIAGEGEGPSESILCEVCYEEYDQAEYVKLGLCGHGLCTYCFTDYVETRMSQGPRDCVFSVCPTHGCNILLAPSIFKRLLDE